MINLFKLNVKKIKNPIVVLDMGKNALSVINELHIALPKENIIYLNDLNIDNYEGHEIDFIQKRIEILLNRVKELNPKLLIIANDTIIEYGKEQIDSLNFPVINIVDEIIEYVNKNYEFKNMAFFATQGIIESNMYQKNFHYTRLYNLNADNMMEVLGDAMMKTNESFNQVRIALFPLYKKDVDVIIPSLPNILLFKTEIIEYAKENSEIDILNINKVLCDKAVEMISKINKDNDYRLKNRKYVYLVLNENDYLNNQNKYEKIMTCNFKVQKIEVKEANI